MPSNLQPRDACYFLTFNVVDRIDLFVRPAYKRVISNALNHFITNNGLILHAWCLMTGHLHLVIRTRDGQGPAAFEREFKKYTTLELLKILEQAGDPRREWILGRFEEYGQSLRKQERYPIWQSCTGQIHIDDVPDLSDRIDQVHENPVRDGLVELQEHYVYSSSRDYAGLKGLVRVSVVQGAIRSSRFKRISSN